MKKFWESYGPEIQKELTAAPESSILSSSTARNENPALGRYHSKLKSQIGDANIANDGEIDRGTPFAAGETGASVIFLRPDKVIDKMGLNLSSNSFAQTGLEKAFQEDFVDALKLIRDKGVEELSEEDKRALFESVYTAFTAKIQSVSDISRFLRHETVKPFIEMGLEPPKEATRAQVEERTREIAERLAPKKKDLREKNRQIKQLSDANQQVPDGLELESVLLSQEVRQLEAEMKAEQNKLQRFGKYNPLDDAHQAHFEAMYARFTGSGISVAQTVNHARNGVAAAVNPRQP
jgi:flagellar biosynthesis GTPase FlhF